MEDIVYKIDENNRITFVNEAWDVFARENNGDEIVSKRIIGRNLFDFISDITVKQIYLDLMEQARNNKKIKIDFRCDSPTYKRYLTMSIQCNEPNTITFITHLIRKEPQNYKSILDSKVLRVRKVIRMCSWCKKVEFDSQWLELDEVINKAKIFDSEKAPMITHTICDNCLKSLVKEQQSFR
ncbi:MAG TPA: hypothetical protein PLT82_01420 [Candidatus Hydrogenedens sp.]|nr:hypothetical protein [Candidatus Hydrogenedens sp.]HOK08560.1 hypothetical protein [Candidatus Hydrogenedens sp.]HOL19048.1 hypothetical protein [Candidatus Hydrogenedens sp.]HPP57770.1 hypothetical protein [Candidatus Hydrogenedens sp.]